MSTTNKDAILAVARDYVAENELTYPSADAVDEIEDELQERGIDAGRAEITEALADAIRESRQAPSVGMMVETLRQLLEEAHDHDESFEEFESVATFDEVGMLTRDKGLVVRIGKRRFAITIQEY